MIKRYCNKCGKELLHKKDYRNISMRIYGKIHIGAEWSIDLCEDCFEAVLSRDTYEAFIDKERKFEERIEEKKRSKNNE